MWGCGTEHTTPAGGAKPSKHPKGTGINFNERPILSLRSQKLNNGDG